MLYKDSLLGVDTVPSTYHPLPRTAVGRNREQRLSSMPERRENGGPTINLTHYVNFGDTAVKGSRPGGNL